MFKQGDGIVSKKNPNSNRKSGGAGFISTLLILSSLSGFSFGGILAGVLLGLGIGKITSMMDMEIILHHIMDIIDCLPIKHQH